jgi:NAD+ kinase
MKIAILKKLTPEAYSIETTLHEQFQVMEPEEAEVLIILGGDGTMTHWAKEFAELGLPFYGINRGTYGFLLNDHTSTDNLVEAINQAELVDFPLLEADVLLRSGEVIKARAFNDFFTKTTGTQTSKHKIFINGINIFPQGPGFFAGDGLIICTPGGSTAYNRAAGGIIIDHKSDSLGLTPVSAFQPSDFRPQLLPGDSIITLEMIEDEKRKHLVVADNQSFLGVQTVTIKRSSQRVTLGFKPDNSYFRKTLELRFPWMKQTP